MFVSRLFIRAVKRQALPVLDPRHQFDPREIDNSEVCFLLPMTVGLIYVGLILFFVLHKAEKNIDRFSTAEGKKVKKQRYFFCAKKKVRAPAITTVTNMIF